ncbi:MAG: hypothetical protein PHY94_06885 [Candidatus Omnitrophica bacterium]|nr:hypothetical protein [Candidatus Omnitrophota bacterium]
MDKGLLKNILIIFLLTVAVFSVVKYGIIIKEKNELTENLNLIKVQLATLEEEKKAFLAQLQEAKQQVDMLSQEKIVLKQNLKAVKKRMSKLFSDLNQTKKAIDDLNAKFLLLKAENITLIKRSEKLSQFSQENESMREKLNSPSELKARINELRKNRNAPLRLEVNPGKVHLEKKILDGNRGFLIKNGQVTYPAKVKIEVIPASEK